MSEEKKDLSIVDFAEKLLGRNLYYYEKKFIEIVDKNPDNIYYCPIRLCGYNNTINSLEVVRTLFIQQNFK